MNDKYIEKATDEYVAVSDDKNKGFSRFNPVVPLHVKLKLDEETKIVKQTRLTPSIFIRAAIMQYLDYIKGVYDYADLSNVTSTVQLPLQLSNECYDDIDMISFITGNKCKLHIIRNAIEYAFGEPPRLLE